MRPEQAPEQARLSAFSALKRALRLTGAKRARLTKLSKRLALISLVFVFIGVGWVYMTPFPAELLSAQHASSSALVDRHGYELREVLSDKQTRARWRALDEIAAPLVSATIAAEDKRFYGHLGVDPVAIVRSVVYNGRRGRVVTGASTLTQQTVKMLMPRSGGALRAKLREAIWALRLERAASKAQILEQYLNRAPYGNQLYGAQAASLMYFDKPAAHLTLAESTLLACIPRAPSVLNPYKGMAALKRCQRRLLMKMRDEGAIAEADYARAASQPIEIKPRRGRVLAPHFTEALLAQLGWSTSADVDEALATKPQTVHTTLDLHLQRDVQGIVQTALSRLEDARVGQAAVVVLETKSAEILAWVGSRDYWDEGAKGANDGVLARRQPGSALKPFVYGALLEQGTPSTQVFLDWEVQFGTDKGAYIPKNYDHRYHGPVSMRVALASSLNIPAILAAEQVGVETLLKTLRSLGLETLDLDAQHYGLGIALGNGEVRLLDLAAAYATLGRDGRWVEPRRVVDATQSTARQVYSPQVSAILLDMLSDDEARAVGFGRYSVLSLPYKVAVKTGTSTDYRDNWSVGVTPDYTVAVWAGNFDGSPMIESSGVTGAAPIMRQVLQTLYPEAAGPVDVPWFELPEGLTRVNVCVLSGQLANERCDRRELALMRQAQADALPVDAMHVEVSVDMRDGGLVDEGCAVEVGETQTLRAYALPGTWLSWAERERLPLVPTARSARCGDAAGQGAAGADTEQLRVLHPLEGDVFIIDPEMDPRAQQVTLRAAVPPRRQREALRWFVDGQVVATVRSPFEFRWQLRAGEHVIGVGAREPEAQVRVRVMR